MKKHFTLTAAFILLAVSLMAQYSSKEVRSSLKMKPPRVVRQQVKEYKKDGYYVAVGAPTLERQLANAWMRETEIDETGYPKYVVATGRSVGETQIAAKLQATEAAKLELAGTLATNVAALIESNIANAQLNMDEAASVTKSVGAAKNIIAQEIGRIITMVELYKDLGKNIEVNLRIAYNSDMAKEVAKKVIRKQLEDETEIVMEKLEKLMNF